MSGPSLNNQLRKALEQLALVDKEQGIKSRFQSEDDRASRFSFCLDGLFVDFSKTHISSKLVQIYLDLAEQASLSQKRHALFSGEAINNSENRAVLHPLLRDPDNQGIKTVSLDLNEQAHDARRQLLDQCKRINTQLANRSVRVTDIIHIGIGGSVLGTQLLFEAIAEQTSKIKIHFISNIDAHKLVRVLSACTPESTIVIGVSKTFSTAETLQNLNSIGVWYQENTIHDYRSNIYAVTTNQHNAVKFGVDVDNIVTFPEWVGGRYSVWSSVSLSAVIVLGIKKFQEFLAGAAQIDKHFYQTPFSENICFIAAMLDHYYTNFMHAGSRAIFSYDSRLLNLVNYLQQLETESNGKDRQTNGQPVDQKTSPVVWGGVGTDVQHSVFQMLHQGTSLIPSEFIVVKTPDHNLPEHHVELLANAIAQPAALLAGQDFATVQRLHATEELSELTLHAKIFSGERPSTTILLERLSPYLLGLLLAFYEHRTFCTGVLSNINSFDQMGVELGKRLAKQVQPLLSRQSNSAEVVDGQTQNQFDPSTWQLINRLLDRD